MNDDKSVWAEGVTPAGLPGQPRPGAAHPPARGIQPAPAAPGQGARPEAIQAEAPRGAGRPEESSKKSSLKRRLLMGAGVLLVLLLLGAALGLVPLSYSRTTVAGRSVVVASSYPSIAVFGTPEMTRIDSGGQS